MKSNRLAFVTAFLLSAAIALIVVIFDFIKDAKEIHIANPPLLFIISILLIFGITYLGITLLFRYNSKTELQRMAESLPEDLKVRNQRLDFKEFSEKISVFHQEQESQMDTLKEMENYRREYIGNISHELKTPIFTIQGYVETLRDGAVENLKLRDKYLDRIGYSVERLTAIVKDLEMINRFETGEINLEISNFDLNALIKEIFELLDLEAEKNKIKLKLQTSQNQTLVSADRQKIAQVLINLITNAIHYVNRQEASITIRTRMIRTQVLVEVEDNGMGIKPELLPRIFERFFRIESSRNRAVGGSGLGLAIVKHIMEAHHQNITVESTYLEGTKFSFTLNKAQ